MLYMFALRAEIVTIFGSKMLTISARTVIQTYTKFANFARLYLSYFTTFRNHTFCNFTNLKPKYIHVADDSSPKYCKARPGPYALRGKVEK